MPRKLSDRRARHDQFHQRARKLGFRARAIFKLEEIDKKLHIIEHGQRVLDLGCSPGSWLQYCAPIIGDKGHLVGLDRGPIDPPVAGARTLVGDVHEIDPRDLLGELTAFDVVLSDMAPDTIGIRHTDQSRSEVLFERALFIAEQTLEPGGRFVGKLFQGPDFQLLINRCRERFERVNVVKPAGSRQKSIEQYVVGMGYKKIGS